MLINITPSFKANLVSGATVWRLSGTPDEPKLENLGDLAPQDSSTTVRYKLCDYNIIIII